MKKTMKTGLWLFMVILVILTLMTMGGCKTTAGGESLWEKATYQQDQTFGDGKTTVQVEVKAGEKAVTFTVKTDRTILSEALFDHHLIEGDAGDYGLYLKTVNGITADYDADQHYWAFYKDGEYMMTGMDGTKIADGDHYELVYSK